jgi:hypothetical protein
VEIYNFLSFFFLRRRWWNSARIPY